MRNSATWLYAVKTSTQIDNGDLLLLMMDGLMLQHIGLPWEGDALVIEEQCHKVDQKGQEKFGQHIYTGMPTRTSRACKDRDHVAHDIVCNALYKYRKHLKEMQYSMFMMSFLVYDYVI